MRTESYDENPMLHTDSLKQGTSDRITLKIDDILIVCLKDNLLI